MNWLRLVCLAGCLCGGGGALRRPQNVGPQKYEFQVCACCLAAGVAAVGSE